MPPAAAQSAHPTIRRTTTKRIASRPAGPFRRSAGQAESLPAQAAETGTGIDRNGNTSVPAPARIVARTIARTIVCAARHANRFEASGLSHMRPAGGGAGCTEVTQNPRGTGHCCPPRPYRKSNNFNILPVVWRIFHAGRDIAAAHCERSATYYHATQGNHSKIAQRRFFAKGRL